MKFKNKLAYSLAEIMIVMLVLTIIFAACAPFFTKRRTNTDKSRYAVWEALDITTMDAYTNGEIPQHTAQLFFGLTPGSKDEVNSMYAPNAKIVIRSGPVTSEAKVQRQIQFRYGRFANKKHGVFAGTWLMDGSNNLMGGRYKEINPTSATQNTAVGYDSLTSLYTGTGNTAIGYNALAKLTNGTSNTAIGYNAGYYSASKNNTSIGAGAGYSSNPGNNTSIGYNAGKNITGQFNLSIGSLAGNNGSKNVAVGYSSLNSVTTGEDNVALGAGALRNLTTGNKNTAIGYNACSELTSQSNKTCIGANSGPKSSRTHSKYLFGGNFSNADNVPRTYIGSTPYNFGGDAVLEIHNAPNPNDSTKFGVRRHLEGGIAANTTTIVNGNLIIRGRPYFTSGSSLYHIYEYTDSKLIGSDAGSANRCSTDTQNYKFSATNCPKWPNQPSTSDRRLKNILGKNNDGLNKLAQVKVHNYTFKDDAKKAPHVGVIAQELQKVFPNSVLQGEDGYLRIRWDEMFFAAINAVKELDRKIVTLVKRVVGIESQITKLENENKALETQVNLLSQRVEKLKVQK